MKIVKVVQASAMDYTHEQLAEHLVSVYGYDETNTMFFEYPQDDNGEIDNSQVRIVVYGQ